MQFDLSAIRSSDAGFSIGEVSRLTGVKAGTIRFYEKSGFLENVERLSNHYRIFNVHHLYQVRVCRLVFGGFVNKNLRKVSWSLIEAARIWDIEAYGTAALNYQKAVEDDIARTGKAIGLVMRYMGQEADTGRVYSKKQAADMIGVTAEAIRNWERNGLLEQSEPYQRRFYGQYALNRMYVIRLLLDTGYSMMAIRSFLAEHDDGREEGAVKILLSQEEREELRYTSDRYLKELLHVKEKAALLCELSCEMKKI